MSVVALEDDGPFIQIIILASADMNSVTSVVVVITAYRFGGSTCACAVVGMRAMCTGCAVKKGCMRIMMVDLVLSTLVLFITLDVAFK